MDGYLCKESDEYLYPCGVRKHFLNTEVDFMDLI
jgi:hypothetical protein